jgi:branched-chain amino acid transport system ATP-binding protein
MLALGMILTKRPKILLLDEPSAGLAPSLVKSLLGTIREIKKRFHTSILLVEQNIKEALRISDRAYLLRAGKIEVEGTSENILRCKEIEEVFFA